MHNYAIKLHNYTDFEKKKQSEKANYKILEFKEYGDDTTTLYHVFHCNIKSPDAKVANDDECDFFKSLM